MRSLVLIGHGSFHHPAALRDMGLIAERLRQSGMFTDVLEAYWQGEPSLRQVLRLTASSDVTVLPMFLAEGYLTETVLPRELGLGFQGKVPAGGVARVLGGRSVRYLPPYGVHARLTEAALQTVRRAVPEGEWRGTDLILVGQAADPHAERLCQRGLFASVRTLHPHDLPDLPQWWAQAKGERQVILPFLPSLSAPWRERLGAPSALELPPITAAPEVADLILELWQEGHPQPTSGDIDLTHAEVWRAVLERPTPTLRVGEVMITETHGVYELRHSLDEGRPSSELATVVTPEGLRDQTLYDDAGHYRPLRTRRDLPRGWRAVLSAQDLPLGLHFLYPSAAEDAYAYAGHSLRSTPWASTARRQTGSFAKVQRAGEGTVEKVVGQVCAHCLRTPLWAGHKLGPTFLAGAVGGLPCAEACMYFVSRVRDEVARES